MSDVIAEQQVIWVMPDGSRQPGRIVIMAPWVVPDGDGEVRCEFLLDGLEPTESISGGSTLEALILAVRLVGNRLHVFTTRGGSVIRAGFNYASWFHELFGTLVTDPPPASEFDR